MALSQMTDNLNIIAGLGDNPNGDNGLSSDGLKAKFDEAGNLIQQFINTQIVAFVNQLEKNIAAITGFDGNHGNLGGRDEADQHPIEAITGLAEALATAFPISGGTMEGEIDMDFSNIVNLNPPVDTYDAANKGYVDEKVDGQFVPLSGGTMTGALGTTRVTIDEGSGNNPRAIFNHGGTQLGIHYVRTTDAKNVFAQYLGDVVERFALPAVTNASGDTTYNILTTKTVKYGTDDPETAVGKAGTAGRIYFKKVT